MLKPSAEVVVLPSGMTSAVAEAMVTAVRYPPRPQHLHCDESATQLGLNDIGRINSNTTSRADPVDPDSRRSGPNRAGSC